MALMHTSAQAAAAGTHAGRLPADILRKQRKRPRFRVSMASYLRSRAQASLQQFTLQAKQFFTPRIVAGLGVSAAASFSIGFLEATHALQGTPSVLSVAQDADLLHFCASYSADQMLASFAMASTPPELIISASDTLSQLPIQLADHTLPENAASALVAKRCEAARITLTQLVTVTQLFRLATVTMRARDTLHKHIKQGRHPPKVRGERFIRLCGERSDITPLSLERCVCLDSCFCP